MSKTYNVIMMAVLIGGAFCTILADTTAFFAAGLCLVIIGAAGLSSGYVTFLDNDAR